ncbi:MAG TPA: glycyl-radical enzyme activating protein, partial [Clostridia bacterium]|nr:glycyl-radical enzyme activating protein [Clostridia bacterium]
FYDIKLMDPVLHRKYTGKTNELILNNLKALCADRKIAEKILIRIPCIPNVNDSPEQIVEIANFVLNLGIQRIELMPYNEMAPSKYEWVDRTYPLGDVKGRSKDYYRDLNRLVAEMGIRVI